MEEEKLERKLFITTRPSSVSVLRAHYRYRPIHYGTTIGCGVVTTVFYAGRGDFE